jgi:hypothetical protein
MPLEIAWKADSRLAALHLAYCRVAKSLIDSRELPNRLDADPLLEGCERLLLTSQERFWDLLFQLSPDSISCRELAERLCVRCLAPEMRSDRLTADLAGRIREAEVYFGQRYSNFAEEMKLRTRPMQEQWEAYGPGLLNQLNQFLKESLMVDSAEVYLVPPVSGGMGWAHLHTNRCHVEALLTNPDSELPEVMRLAWLLAQLDFERPEYSDWISTFRLRRVAGLATLPPVLLAGEELGLCTTSVPLIHRAIELWRLELPGPKAQALAEVLSVWWQTVCSGQTRWSIALTGLDRMIGDE